MTVEETEKLAMRLLRQYKDVPSLDKSRDLLVQRYGEADFIKVRARMAALWLRQQNGLPLLGSVKPAPQKKGPGKPVNNTKHTKKRLASITKKTLTSASKQLSPKVPPQYVPSVIKSSLNKEKRITINGVSVGLGAPPKDIAHLLLLAYGSPEAIKRLSMYLSKKLTTERFEKTMPFVTELYSVDSALYKIRYEEKLKLRKDNRARQRKLKEERLLNEKEKKTVQEQNLHWQKNLQQRKKAGRLNYFKLIYTPMGNKR